MHRQKNIRMMSGRLLESRIYAYTDDEYMNEWGTLGKDIRGAM